jgi:hypothetical protein
MKTDEDIIVYDAAVVTFFSLLGVTALAGAAWCDAWWHWFSFVVCALVALAHGWELARLICNKKKYNHEEVERK